MSAAMVRTGGIMAFGLILIGLVLSFILAAALTGAGSGTGGAAVQANVGSTIILMYIVNLAIATFVYWTTKGLFNAFGYRAADLPIMTLIILLAVNLIPILLGNPNPSTTGAGPEPGGGGALGILSAIVMLATVFSWIWFSIAATGFGKQVGSRLWQAIGILYLTSMALFAVGMVLMTSGGGQLPALFFLIASPVMLGGWVCHGIGLIIGANEMSRT